VTAAGPKRSWFVPEVVQTSAMDCGAASLKSLLEGFGVSVSYGRLREACQTDVDGTSIDVLEDVANDLGLAVEQQILPVDHLLLPEAEALPSIVVVKLAGGANHFVVLWRRHGSLLQVMDPQTGRRWTPASDLLKELSVQKLPLSASAWRAWAGSRTFTAALERQLRSIGVAPHAIARLMTRARADASPVSIATLDAATRMVRSVVDAAGLRPGAEATRAVFALFEQGLRDSSIVPGRYWSVKIDPRRPGVVIAVGAVLVRAKGLRATRPTRDLAARPSSPNERRLSPDLVAALAEAKTNPLARLWAMLCEDGVITPALCGLAIVLASFAALLETLVFRSMVDVGGHLAGGAQRIGAMTMLIVLLASVLAIELPISALLLRLGRQLEVRLRVAYLTKLPRLGDRYFKSRLASDMAERGHMLHVVRRLPDVGARALRAGASLLVTVAGVAWLDPKSAVLAVLVAVLGVALPLAFQPLLSERDLRARTHAGALTRFYLDALVGLVPIRAHGAERAVRREHEALLVEWQSAGLRLARAAIGVDGVLAFAGLGLSGWLVARHLLHARDLAGVLLLVYWAMQLPVLAGELARAIRQYPSLRNVVLRVTELLSAPEEHAEKPADAAAVDQDEAPTSGTLVMRAGALHRAPGVDIVLDRVTARAGGHTILDGISARIAPGSHVAIVGSSGAGKSSLVGLLLGWHKPASGEIFVDGARLDGAALARVRRETAWVDPAVHLWNEPLFDNVQYGQPADRPVALGPVLDTADLQGVVERLPEGMLTPLGEGGALVSGGEGQRVRLGRALCRAGTRLAILDEPFRGLDREQRRELLARARRWWQRATLLCITHDVSETLAFDRVLVIHDGKLVEDGSPKELRARAGSRYRALLDAEEGVRRGLWSSPVWRRLRLAAGRVSEEPAKVTSITRRIDRNEIARFN
jgi:ATP-binding cassette subfamily B protein